MPKLSIKALLAFLRAQEDPDAVLREWDLVLREDARLALRGPGGTVVVQSTRKGKKELRTILARAIVEGEDPAEVVELPSDDKEGEETP
jgi:hypothetical protein